MERGKRLLFWAVSLFVFATASVVCIQVQQAGAEAESMSKAHADMVTIDTLAAFGDLELPAVTFYHDKHTKALSDQGKDCTACHKKDAKGKQSIKFMRLEDTGAVDIKSTYHAGCIACHAEMSAAGKETGPLDGQCRNCHTVKPAPNAWTAIAMDKSLHFRHVKATGGDEKCGECHHVWDETAKKIVYVKGKEQNCRDCHTEQGTKDVRSLSAAAHTACVTCHMDTAAKKLDAGPATCAGCHEADMQAKIKVVADVPRLKRGQPDGAMLLPIATQGQAKGKVLMTLGPVPFNHQAHEAKIKDCRSCHHKTLEACSTCHTVEGSKDGGFVQLEKAMHQADSSRSCVGCHKTRQAEKAVCAGCHNARKATATPDGKSCTACHTDALKPLFADGAMPAKEVLAATAVETISARNVMVSTIAESEIPETVVIDRLMDKYQASELPHRKIVLRLLKEMKDDTMAGYFHGQETVLCQGCHHNSPASKTPPKCGSCHGKPFDASSPDRPGLKAAYHGQCMGCHKAMNLEKPKSTACVECHKKK